MNKHYRKYINTAIILLQPVWLELFLHIFAKHHLKYAPIYSLFGLALGCICYFVYSLIAIPVKKNKAMRIIVKAGSVMLWLIYVVELMCKSILQTYYSASILSTAAENRLMDYIGQIVKIVLASIPQILVMLIPTVLLFIRYNKHHKSPDFKDRSHIILSLVFALAFHFSAYGLVCVQWPGDLQPKELYNSDSYIIDQVEQLGLASMIRLDIKHMIWPVSSGSEDFVAVTPPPAPVSSKPVIVSQAAIETEAAIEIDTSPNVMDADLAGLAESTKSKDVKWLCDFFQSQTPTNKNEYTGKYKDYNIVLVLMESFTGRVIDPVYTPTLYKLSTEGYNFKNFYTALHYTSTSNGECQTLLGLYPKNGNPISMKRTGELKTNCYFSLAQQLNRIGYNSYGYHNNWDLYGRMDSHNNLGYSWRFASRGLEMEWNGNELKWPQRDSFMIENSVNQYVNDDHFNIYYLTVSQHTPHVWNRIATQFKDQVADAPYSSNTRAYIASAMEVDKALQELIDELDAAGKLDNTLIVACADHVPYSGVEIMEELAGQSFGSPDAVRAINEAAIDFDIYRNTLIMWTPNMEGPVDVDKVCCQVDILPTISNLLGLEYDSRMLAGKDIFSTDEGMVVFSSRCWKTDRGFYNRFTQQFTPAEGVEMTEEETEQYVEYNKAQAANKLDMTGKIIENNFYDLLFGNTEE